MPLLLVLLLAVLAPGDAGSKTPPDHHEGQDELGGLDVTLLDKDGRSVEEADFDLVCLDDGRSAAWLVADEKEGTSFRFHALAPGRYSLTATNEDRGFNAKGYVDIESGSRSSLQLSLAAARPCIAEGKVIRDGKGVAAAQVWAQLPVWPQPLYASTTTGLGGAFTLALPQPGSWLFEVRPPGWDISERGWNIVLSHKFSHQIQPSKPAALTFVIPLGRVEGRVRAPDGSPMAGCDIALQPEDQQRSCSRTLTDRSGHFEFRGLAAGVYRVLTGGPQVFNQGRDSRAYAFECKRIEVPATAVPPPPMAFDLTLGGEVELHFTVPGGRVPEWEWLYAQPASAPDGCWFLAGATVEGGQVKSKGRRTIAGLPAGLVELSFRPDRGAHLASPIGATVEVLAGQRTEAQWELVPATSVVIQALNKDSSPAFLRVLEVRPVGASPVFLNGPESELQPQIKLRPLPGGDYILRASDAAGNLLERELSLDGEPMQRVLLRF